MRISDWSSDVCSSDLKPLHHILAGILTLSAGWKPPLGDTLAGHLRRDLDEESLDIGCIADAGWFTKCADSFELNTVDKAATRSEEHTSELQSLMRISYAVFCLKNNKP